MSIAPVPDQGKDLSLPGDAYEYCPVPLPDGGVLMVMG